MSNVVWTRCCIFPASSKGFVELHLSDFIGGAALYFCAVEITQYMLRQGCLGGSVVLIAFLKFDLSLHWSVTMFHYSLLSKVFSVSPSHHGGSHLLFCEPFIKM